MKVKFIVYVGVFSALFSCTSNGNGATENTGAVAPVVDTPSIANATAFTATPGNAQVTLAWVNPTGGDFAGVKVMRQIGSYPADKDDGVEVYTGIGTTATDMGLTNDTPYFYTAFASDTAGNYASGAQATATPNVTPPANVTVFTATPGDAQVTLTWTNPTDSDFAGVKVMRKTGSYPAHKDDGTVVYSGMSTTVTSAGLTNDTPYFYTAFAYDTAGNYASGAQATATPTPPPTLVSTTPLDGAVNVPVYIENDGSCTAKIKLEFSKSMQSITPSLTAELESSAGSNIFVPTSTAGSDFSWSTTTESNDTLTITLSWCWFPENSKIRYTIAAAGLKDLANNPIAAQVRQSFTTGWGERKFSVSDTDQAKCYDTTGNTIVCDDTGSWPRQDGFYPDNAPKPRNFTVPTAHATYTTDYTTSDGVTGLVWKSCSEGQSGAACTGTRATQSWYIALNRCAALNAANSSAGYAGIKTWRLPTITELETIAEYNTSSAAIDVTAFPKTVTNSFYWSSSPYVNLTSNAWYVGFNSTVVTDKTDKTSLHAVRCVSSGPPPTVTPPNDNGNGTVTDSMAGLVWQKCSVGQTNDATCSGAASAKDWQTALTTCKNLSLAGKIWRLPSIKELLSVVDKKMSNPSIDATAFPATDVDDVYWSSSTYVDSTESQASAANAWYVNFASGLYSLNNKTESNYVRCVATGP